MLAQAHGDAFGGQAQFQVGQLLVLGRLRGVHHQHLSEPVDPRGQHQVHVGQDIGVGRLVPFEHRGGQCLVPAQSDRVGSQTDTRQRRVTTAGEDDVGHDCLGARVAFGVDDQVGVDRGPTVAVTNPNRVGVLLHGEAAVGVGHMACGLGGGPGDLHRFPGLLGLRDGGLLEECLSGDRTLIRGLVRLFVGVRGRRQEGDDQHCRHDGSGHCVHGAGHGCVLSRLRRGMDELRDAPRSRDGLVRGPETEREVSRTKRTKKM